VAIADRTTNERDPVFEDIKVFTNEHKQLFGNRDVQAKEYEEMYLMIDEELKKSAKKVKVTRFTVDPDVRNKTLAAHRLLAANRPQVNVPYDRNTQAVQDLSEEIERACNGMLLASDMATRRKLHSEMALSNLLFDESHVTITRTKDLYEMAEQAVKAGSDQRIKAAAQAAKIRAEQAMEIAPYLYEANNPRTGYPDYDGMGCRSFYREVKMRGGQITDKWGGSAIRSMQQSNIDPIQTRYSPFTVCEFWDLVFHYLWIKDARFPIIGAPHGKPFFPVVCGISEGSSLFEEQENTRQPFLMAENRSGLWKRRNMMLTVLYTLLYTFGFSPTFKFTRTQPGTAMPTLQQMGLFSFFDIPVGGNLEILLNKGIIDQAFMEGLTMAERKGEESTVYKAAIGGYAGGTFSELALLSQLGKMPLEITRQQTGNQMAHVLQTSIKWIVLAGDSPELPGIMGELDLSSITDPINLECDLDLALPKDLLNQASVLNALAGKVPMEDLYEKVLKMGQYKDAQGRLIKEQFVATIIEDALVKIKQGQNPFAPPAQAAPAAAPAGPVPGGEVPPEIAQLMAQQQGQGQAGVPIEPVQPELAGAAEGLPPQLAQMGGQPVPGGEV
jgi:hypothetical protein